MTLKFRFSKKTTKFKTISQLIWLLALVNVKSNGRLFQTLVAFSEYPLTLDRYVLSKYWHIILYILFEIKVWNTRYLTDKSKTWKWHRICTHYLLSYVHPIIEFYVFIILMHLFFTIEKNSCNVIRQCSTFCYIEKT